MDFFYLEFHGRMMKVWTISKKIWSSHVLATRFKLLHKCCVSCLESDAQAWSKAHEQKFVESQSAHMKELGQFEGGFERRKASC